jgi:hypothetical protein
VTWLSQLIFGNFWTTVALAGALGEWTLACWLGGAPGSWIAHLAALVGITLVNRVAAEAFDRERHSAPALHVAGGVVLAGGVVAAAGAGALGLVAGVWLIAGAALGALPAQAGALDAQTGTYFGPLFAPLAGVAVTMGMAIAAWGYTRGHRRLRTTRLDVPMPGLPAAVEGLRIVHISDLHLGPTAHREALREAIERVNAIDPDVVCVSGDLIDSPTTDLSHWTPELARLRARHGVYAVLGNHDRYAGSDRVAGALRTHTGWRLLRDEVVRVDVRGASLHLIGLEDRPGPQSARMLPRLHAQVPDGEPCVVLVHQPAAFATAAALGVPLTLAGHTHGGQVAIPGLPAVNPARLLMTHLDAGTFTSGASVLHVNRGLGTSGQRVRIAVPREITIVTLAAGEAAAAA